VEGGREGEKMEAGLRGLCIREIDVKSLILVHKMHFICSGLHSLFHVHQTLKVFFLSSCESCSCLILTTIILTLSVVE